MKKKGQGKIGLISIGQSPSPALVQQIALALNSQYELIEAGAMDGLSLSEIQGLAPCENDYPLVASLQERFLVYVSKERLMPFIQKKVDMLEKDVELIILLCSEKLQLLASSVPLISPFDFVDEYMKGAYSMQKVGVIVPHPGQISQAVKRWSMFNPTVQCCPLQSFKPVTFKESIILMDCLGYSSEMKAQMGSLNTGVTILVRDIFLNKIKLLVERNYGGLKQ